MPPKKRGRKKKNDDGAGSSRNTPNNDGAGLSRNTRNNGGAGPSRPVIIDLDQETWQLRGEHISIFHPELEYESRPDCFTIALHHHGVFRAGDYLTGMLNYIDYVSISEFDLFESTSMMVRVGYPRRAICESYYCHPHVNDGCVGIKIGHHPDPLIEEDDVSRFTKVATSSTSRLVHVYVLEITPADARARQQDDQIELFKKSMQSKSTSVVIEEIEDPHLVVPKLARKKADKARFMHWFWVILYAFRGDNA